MTNAPSAWDRYWQFDRLASCMDLPGQSNYDDRIAAPWRAFFESVGPGTVLDVCTGNGAIAAIAASQPGLEVIGVDLADIDPAHFVNRFSEILSRVSFRGKTDAADLPFPDASFDAVVSQYGIEYAPRPKALAEAARVLKPGGKLRLVVHAIGAAPFTEAQAMIEESNFILCETALPDRARASFKALDAVESEQAPAPALVERADEAFADFCSALRAVSERVPTAHDQRMMHHSGALLADCHGKRRMVHLSTLLDKVDQLETEILAHRQRTEELVAAAMGPDDLKAATEVLAGCGLTHLWAQPLEAQGGLLGHVIEGRRPAG